MSGFKFSLLFQYLALTAIVADKNALQRYLYPDGKGVSLTALAKSWYSFLNSINEAKVLIGIWLDNLYVPWYQSAFLIN